ncbi:MAG: hypothetical protein HUJ91_01420 [Bacteroidales bacterium]|nr:hypothetical protein [Bacteroidales bacterium]
MVITIYILAAIVCAALPFVIRRKGVAAVSTFCFVAFQLFFSGWALFNKGVTVAGFFTADALGLLMLSCLAIVVLPTTIHSGLYLREDRADASSCSIYAASYVLLIAALSLGYLSNHIALTWVFTEVTTLSAAMLIYHHRNRQALEGTWKYVFVCAISVTFVFIGILLISLSLLHAGSSDLSYESLALHAAALDGFWLKLGFIFIVVGYTAKMGLFPMFTAGIDAKDNAPAPIAALLASVLVNLGFVGIYRTYSVVSATPLCSWSRVLLTVLAFITLFVATAYMLRVRNIKRMLAYSGIEHMAIVTLGIAAGRVGCYAAILHIVMHTFVKSGLFLHFNQLYRVFKSKMADAMGGYFNYYPFGAMVLLLGVVSIVAVPPSGLFVSEFMIFKAMFGAGHFALLALALILLTVLIWAFVRNFLKIIFIPLPQDNLPSAVRISPWESVTQLLLFAVAIYIGYAAPPAVMELIGEAAAFVR